MSPSGRSNLLSIRRLLHPSTLNFNPIRGRFFAQVLPKFLVVRSAGIAHQRIAMPVPESKEDRAAVPVISQVLPREPDGKGMKKRSNGGRWRCWRYHRCWPDGKTEILAKGDEVRIFQHQSTNDLEEPCPRRISVLPS